MHQGSPSHSTTEALKNGDPRSTSDLVETASSQQENQHLASQVVSMSISPSSSSPVRNQGILNYTVLMKA